MGLLLLRSSPVVFSFSASTSWAGETSFFDLNFVAIRLVGLGSWGRRRGRWWAGAWRWAEGQGHRLFTISLSHGKLILFIQSYSPLIKLIILIWFKYTFALRSYKNFWANFGLSQRVDLQTSVKLWWVMTFCVTAIVSSKFMTACHIPPGTKTVYPGPWMNSLRSSSYLLYFYLILGRISTK